MKFFSRYFSPNAWRYFYQKLIVENFKDLVFLCNLWKVYHWLIKCKLRQVPCKTTEEKKIEFEALFTTTTGLFYISDGECYKLLKGRFTGLTRYKDRYFIAEELFETKRCRIMSFLLENGEVVSMRNVYSVTDRGGFHQIDFIENKIYLADTHNNNITVLSQHGVVECKIFPNRVHTSNRPNHNTDSQYYCHYNSVFGHAGNIYVLAHNETSKTGKVSQVYAIDQKNYECSIELPEIICGGNSHNILLHNGHFFICDSLNGNFLCDGQTVLDTPYFTRGLAMNKEYIAIGCSEWAERFNRNETKGFIYLINHQFEMVKSYELGQLGQVYDIRLLGGDYGLSNESEGAKNPANHNAFSN